MQLDDLVKDISRLYAQQTEKGILFGILLDRDVCVSTEGPFKVELVGRDEKPEMHGETAYVRYEIARRTIAKGAA